MMKVIVAIDQSEYGKQILKAVLERHWPPDTWFKILELNTATVAVLQYGRLAESS